MCLICLFSHITKFISLICLYAYKIFKTICLQFRKCKGIVNFLCGFTLGQIIYNYYLLKIIPFSYNFGNAVSLVLSLLLGLGSALLIQVRCIYLLTLPMYCGKPGRGVLKAVVLTYVVAGPITNMGLNAQEVVRVFACSTQLSYNLSRTKYGIIVTPLKKSLSGLGGDIDQMKDTIRSIKKVIDPIANEIEGTNEEVLSRKQNDYVDDLLGDIHRSVDIDKKYSLHGKVDEKDLYLNKYEKKLEIRCENQFSRAVAICMNMFNLSYDTCCGVFPCHKAFCEPMKLHHICHIKHFLEKNVCDSGKQMDPGLGEGYACLRECKKRLTNTSDIQLHCKILHEPTLSDTQDAKKTGDYILQDLEEKTIIMRIANVMLNICVTLLFLRIFLAAVTYHDMYLMAIEHDNVYVTSYFKEIDERRRVRHKHYLLPLKKMERNKYVDVRSLSYVPRESNLLVTHILKVMLEVVTATTFVMLDRLFYEALDVVRRHSEMETIQEGMHDLQMEVEGTGSLAKIVGKVIDGFSKGSPDTLPVSNKLCLPHPHLMRSVFFFKIYGGYLWILILLYLNPYTLRLKRLICSYFYPHREKQRILHLYNDILKKRMKMQKTLHKKAVQAVRAHYLSGENLLSMRIKFPRILGWLKFLPAARMACLICGETEPRINQPQSTSQSWYSCAVPKCPFVYCLECWSEVGARCLACDPGLIEYSDMDSLSEDEHLRY